MVVATRLSGSLKANYFQGRKYDTTKSSVFATAKFYTGAFIIKVMKDQDMTLQTNTEIYDREMKILPRYRSPLEMKVIV